MARLPHAIVVVPASLTSPADRLYVIAIDGSMWFKTGTEEWSLIRPLPQDELIDCTKYLPEGLKT